MRANFEYRVYYRDGTVLEQWLPLENRYRNLETIFDKHKESRIILVQWVDRKTNEVKLETPIDEGQKPIIRFRVEQKLDPLSGKKIGPPIRHYLLGKHWIETYFPDGYNQYIYPDIKPVKVNKQLLFILLDNGTVIASDRWRDDISALNPVKLIKGELLDDE